MMLAAARALAANSPAIEDPQGSLLPRLAEIRRVAVEIAVAVGREAQKDNLAPVVSDEELRRRVIATQWTPAYEPLAEARP
jgi:malate dehydrogenase (oxaloacetate-decarboxylating)